jgi:hypothetical protein
MKTKLNLFPLSVFILILVILLSGCDYTKIKVGEVRVMYGSNEDGHISYDFKTFTGFESGSAQVEKGEIIFFDYQATVDKGSLLIEWQDPNGEIVWQENLSESERGNVEIGIETSGKYTIIIQGKNAAGNFDVSWMKE